ncbi:probable ATP-dependent RNA helicase spindle-E [Plutella xylostella]|uniref:probable ATP-dependent RNA helicase spindle-E n=1 Tax=Plutella xylostella TaxID=51655 RepID=UPI002032E3A8|nr:probable ATP-dependent RNA helicase spindle-E [Plutella xylostella]
MDELRAFYNNPGRKVIKLRGPQTCGIRLTEEDNTDDLNRRQEHRRTVLLSGTDYAREIKENEIQTYLRNETERGNWESMSHGLESLERLSSFGASQSNIGELTEEAMTEVYKKYSFQVKEDTNHLPIHDFKQQILDRIHGQPVVIIEGPTGCGKTTQVPQWILDDCYARRKHCKIIVTQPRRIAAISIAKRVAQERGWDVGGPVGFQVGLENRTTTDTCINYVTTGILLQKLVASKTLNEYTHIILDEVHERGQEMDFLLLVVKRLLYTVSPGVKVILMSATFNYLAFASYFLIPTPTGLEPSSCIKIEKKHTMFTVKTFYLNHLHKFGSLVQKAMPKKDEPTIEPDMYKLVIKLVNAFEQIDKQEDNYSECDADIPSVLIFLPGINEIEDLYEILTNPKTRAQVCDEECAKYKWWVLPLHSTITADEQVRVFQRAPPGHRKIILSTNLAESSITVPDIKYVIDFCLMKILVADEQTNFTSLQLHWAAKNNCEQRAGRAGRVRDGRVYRLVTDKFYETLPQECAPEIQRCPLERLVLLAKMLDMGPPSHVLALAMDPPDMAHIHRTTLVLKEVGALKKTLDGELSVADGDITYLGRVMAKLPLDVRVSKLIMLGHIFGCLEDTVIMAAAMSVKNIFSSPFRERLDAYNSKLTWADGSTSDCIAFLNVYKVWTHLRKQQHFKHRNGSDERSWARSFYVQVRALRELDDLVRELKLRLSREGIEAGQSPWSKSELPLVLKVLIAGAFYPHYFIQVGGDEQRERDAVKTLGGLNPRTTVYLKDFPATQPGEVYASSIRKIVQQLTSDEPRVTFDKNSAKVYLSFDDDGSTGNRGNNKHNPNIPGKVVLPVYKAIKARQLKMDIRLALLPQEKADELAAALQLSKMALDKDLAVPKLPEIDDTHFPLTISHFIDVGRFYVQYDDASTSSDVQCVLHELNSQRLLAFTGEVAPGGVYAAPYHDQKRASTHYRVTVMKVLPDSMVWVFYMDYGMYGRVNSTELRELPKGACSLLPPLAMQCVLAEVQPSPLLEARAQWTAQARDLFHDLARRKPLLGKVYSVAHGVVSIELLAKNGQINVNQALVERGYAVPCEESYESKLNHDLRETATELNMAQKRAYNRQQVELAFQELREAAPPSVRDCVADVLLKGPFSPLESTVHNLMFASRDKQVVIEWNSVNAVLLDTDPQAVYERLLVAGVVGTNESAGKLTLRHTTLMPNIPGLPAIIALLFCPTTELRRDSTGTRYVSALCGLGSTDSGAPLFPEHDLLVDVDAELSVDDIGEINHIRHLMDYMMLCGPGQDSPSADDEFRPQVPAIIRRELMQLLCKRRKHRECQSVAHAWDWNSVPEDELLEITQPDMLAVAVVFPLHAPLELRALEPDAVRLMKQENDQLTTLVMRTPLSSSKELPCKLCGTEPMPMQAMRLHLSSLAHRDKEKDFRMFDA